MITFGGGSYLRHQLIEEILDERSRQDDKFGEQNHEPDVWLSILTEEVGELAKEFLNARFGERPVPNLRTELIQVCAVSLAMLQCCDRNNWTKQ